MKKQMIMAALVCVLCLEGCHQIVPEGNLQSGEDNFISMENTPELSYEVPVSTPGILLNRLGYLTGDTKEAVFKGSEMPDVFYVINADSKEVVYTGFLKDNGYNGEPGEYNSYGDFTQLQTPGSYYIEAPILGRSYSFSIGDQVYDEVFREACRQYYYNRCGITLTAEYAGENAHNACHTGKAFLMEDTSVSLDVTGGWHQDEKGQKNVAAAAQAMSVMMLSYELYPNAFTDDMGIPESGNGIPDLLDEVRYEVEWMLKMQNQQTGAVYAGVAAYESGNNVPGKSQDSYVEPASAQAERAFAMALARFSYLYKNFDSEYATSCLKAADRAWKHAEQYEENDIKDKWRFASAAELYRAAGQRSYRRYAEQYLGVEGCLDAQDEIILSGCVAYISTKQTVNLTLCNKIMKMLMQQAENIAASARTSIYLTTENKEQDNSRQLLLNMMYLSVVNQIIANYEYKMVIENHLHYLLGRNDNAVIYVGRIGTGNYGNENDSPGIMKQFDADSKLIFMFGGIADSLEK